MKNQTIQIILKCLIISNILLFSATLIQIVCLNSSSMYDVNYVVSFFLNTYCKQTGSVIAVVLFVTLSLFLAELMIKGEKSLKTQLIHQILFFVLLVAFLSVIIVVTVQLNGESRSNYGILVTITFVAALSVSILILHTFYLLSSVQSTKFTFILVAISAIVIPVVLNVVAMFIPQLYFLQKTLFQAANFDPIFIAERGNTHLAAENTAESILAIARRMYAKRIQLDVVMTKDKGTHFTYVDLKV